MCEDGVFALQGRSGGKRQFHLICRRVAPCNAGLWRHRVKVDSERFQPLSIVLERQAQPVLVRRAAAHLVMLGQLCARQREAALLQVPAVPRGDLARLDTHIMGLQHTVKLKVLEHAGNSEIRGERLYRWQSQIPLGIPAKHDKTATSVTMPNHGVPCGSTLISPAACS